MCERNPASLTGLLLKRQYAPGSSHIGSQPNSRQAYRSIESWAESDSLKRCSASYCQLYPPPRSTIAAAFSPDGQLVASTHGDHTVKVICVRTGKCLQTLTGHRRTPWVVRFHPTSSTLLASGSLDYEVRLWNARTAECINVHNFGRPIASLAFHIEGDALAVASGHKLYMWQYTKQQQGEEGAPPVALKTRRSLRAVHFHPLGLPLVLTAEVNDVNTPVTLPFGAQNAEESTPAEAAAPSESAEPVQPEPEASRVHFQDTEDAARDSIDAGTYQRQPHRRLSEVFRAMMDEEREEELLAQLESSVSLRSGQRGPASASRQILHMTGHTASQPRHMQAARQGLRHSLDNPMPDAVPIYQPRARPPAFHPLAHTEGLDMQATNRSASQPVAAPFNSVRFALSADYPAAAASASTGTSAGAGSSSDNPTHLRAQAWTQHRQQQQSVLNSQCPSSLDTSRRPDRSPGRVLMRHSMHSTAPHPHSAAAPSWHSSQMPLRSSSLSHAAQVPSRSSSLSHAAQAPSRSNSLGQVSQAPTRSASLTHAASSSFSRRQSAPIRGLDDEWPVVGTPPVHAHKLGSLHLPPPSPSRSHSRPQTQQAQTQQPHRPPAVAPFGLQGGWAAGLARGAEWMGEATGLSFLVRPFQRSATPGSTNPQPSSDAQASSSTASSSRQSSTTALGSSQAGPSHATAAGTASTASSSKSPRQDHLAGGGSGFGPRPSSAPSHGGASYRERLLSGGFVPDAASPAASFSRQPGHQPQLGFPSQQELQASQARWVGSSQTDPSAGGSAAPVSQLSGLGPQTSEGNTSLAGRPSGLLGLSAAADGLQAAHNGHGYAMRQQAMQVQDPESAEQAEQPGAEHTASMESFPLPNFNWPAQVNLDGQLLEAHQHGAAALPPSMLNMGWEYPAQLLQGADPVLNARHPAGPEHTNQQPNNAVANAVRASAAAANIIGTEQPCRVRLRLWHCSAATPTAALEAPSLTIPDAVLCSEMGVHFSACGRFLAACVACQAEHLPELSPDAGGIIYEVRVYSLEAPTLGEVLHAKQIRAAHCLTSVQFSPTSEHLLLAYGRRHISLLRSLVPDGTSSIIPVHTILEVYRVSDMSLVRVLPSAEDEVNAAAFHPHPGGGIAYGTKEGKLRILRHDPRPEARTLATCQQPRGLEDELREAESIYEDEVLM